MPTANLSFKKKGDPVELIDSKFKFRPQNGKAFECPATGLVRSYLDRSLEPIFWGLLTFISATPNMAYVDERKPNPGR
jgi:hypothetical protein